MSKNKPKKASKKVKQVHLKGKEPKTASPRTPISGLKISRPNKSEVVFKSASKRGSIYQPVLDEMAKLTPDAKPIQVNIPDGCSPRVLHNRLSTTMRRIGPKPPKGYDWLKRTGLDNGKEVVLIMLVKKDPKTAA